jgi:hypothetical protein
MLLVPMMLIMGGASPAPALNEPTHEIINEQAVRRSPVLDTVLKDQLGVPEGINRIVSGIVQGRVETLPIWRWLRRGGTLEDSGTDLEAFTGRARYFRHFHDPLRPWDQSGLNYRGRRYESSIRWAQRRDQDLETGYGNFSWADALFYYRVALTSANKDNRDQRFADLFRGLGQIMHLVVDASVPEHVRDDPHPMGTFVYRMTGSRLGNYEYWVWSQHVVAAAEPGFIGTFLGQPITLDSDLLRIPIPPAETVASAPIARLFDSDQYTGSNPEVTAGAKIGIAEVANANFFSEDTINTQYPHPEVQTMVPSLRVYPRTGMVRSYYRKTDPGLAVDPSAVECVLDEAVGTGRWCVDPVVWRETATHMLPRAVRYAQEVLDYFFRGRLRVVQLVPSTTSVDPDLSLPQAEDTGPDIDRITVWLLNASRWGGQPERIIPSAETGRAGDLTLVARYKDGGGAAQSATFVLENPAAFTSLPHEADGATGVPLAFVLAAGSPVPTTQATNLEYTLVFQGQLGAEQGAVIGLVLSAPVLQRVSLRSARLGVPVTGTGDGLDAATSLAFAKRFPSVTQEVGRDATSITAIVPDGIGVAKPGAGGLRLLKTLPTGDKIYSNPVPFTPLAEGVLVRGVTSQTPLPVTVEAIAPIIPSAPEPLPEPIAVTLPPGSLLPLTLPTGFRYITTPLASGLSPAGLPVEFLLPGSDDFVFGF